MSLFQVTSKDNFVPELVDRDCPSDSASESGEVVHSVLLKTSTLSELLLSLSLLIIDSLLLLIIFLSLFLTITFSVDGRSVLSSKNKISL